MSESLIFFKKKGFLDFPELSLGRVGKQGDICILSFIQYNIKRKASEPKQITGKTKKFDSHILYNHVLAF